MVRGSNSSNPILSLIFDISIGMTPKIYNAQIRLLDSLIGYGFLGQKSHNERINWAQNYKDTN